VDVLLSISGEAYAITLVVGDLKEWSWGVVFLKEVEAIVARFSSSVSWNDIARAKSYTILHNMDTRQV